MATTRLNLGFSPNTEITVDEEPLLKPSEVWISVCLVYLRTWNFWCRQIAAAAKCPTRQPGLLEGVGSAMFSWARYFVAKAENLPRPLSSAVGVVEDVFGPQLSSSSCFVEHCTLDLLRYVDNQLDWTLATVERSWIEVLALVLESKDAIMRAMSKLGSGTGFMNYATDLLASYELVVKAQTSSILQVVLATASKASPAPSAFKLEGQKMIDDSYESGPADLDLKPEKLNPKEDRQLNGDKKLVHEIVPAQENHRSPPAIRKPLKTKSVEPDDENDELSKLIDATWCLGSPRR